MSELNGKISTPGELRATINPNTRLKGLVSVGGVLIDTTFDKRGLKGDKGDTGDTGNGIASAVLNGDYTLTLTFTDGTTYTTPAIRGATGQTGVGIASTVLNDDYTLTITFTDGTTYTTGSIRGATGQTGVGISSITQNGDYTLTITLSDGTSYTTSSVRGQTGATGQTGVGIQSIYKTGETGTNPRVDEYTIVFTDSTTTTFNITNGVKGDTGATGQAATIAVGTVTTGAAGTSASVTNSGTSSAAVFDFTIPKGDKGDKGDTGIAATITVGSTTTGNAGTSASVTNSGTQSAAVLDFTIPKGDKGDTGATGHSPVVTASKTSGTTTVYVDGTAIASIQDGLVQDVTVNGTSVLNGTTAEIKTFFSGSTNDYTPSVVKAAIDAGRAVEISHSTALYGTIIANYFNISVWSQIIASNVIAYDSDSDTWYLFELVGSLTTDLWNLNVTTIPTTNDIPTATSTTPKMDGTASVGSETTWAKGDHVHPTDTSRAASSHTHGKADITDFPSLATVATSGSYSDLSNKPSIPANTSDLVNDSLFARGHVAAFNGTCSTEAGTGEKAVTCADFKAADLVAGAIIVVTFSNANSAAVADLKLNVNSTGAKSIKINSAGTLSNLGDKGYLKAASYPFIYNGTYWVLVSYDTNTNTIGYTIRTNGLQIPVKTACYRYRICFTSPDGNYLIPANASTSTSATASKTVTTEKIDPFGRIIYYSYTTAIAGDGVIGTGYQMQQYNGVTLGYSFNRTGAALTMTSRKPVYVKCAPQTDGSAIIDSSTPFVQALPSTEDGKIYIFLGVATSATAIEFTLEHPVYCYKKGAVRQWTNAQGGGAEIAYCTCTDSASTVAKTATVVSGSVTLESGALVAVKFDYQNTAASPTLNVGGTGAKSIKKYGTTAVGQNVNESWNAGSIVLLVYDGTNWIVTDFLNTTYSGGTGTAIQTGTDNLNYIWSPAQLHDGINAMLPSVPSASSTTPKMDGTASVGSETTWAKGDHVHPSDTSKQDTLVSGTNIKTINNTSLLGSGDIAVLTAETDPVFSASAAAGITSSDITEWDNSYDGKVSLDTSAASGTDHDLYAAIVALGWQNDVIE